MHIYRAEAYLGVNQPDRAQTAARQALALDPSIVVDAREFGQKTAALVEGLRRASANPEATGDAAEQSNRVQEAFLAYVNAYRALPDPPRPADDERLRTKIIGVVAKLDAKPEIPPDAYTHLRKADDLIKADAILAGGGTAGIQQAVAELQQALRIAPWWPDATFRLATALQKLQRVDEALANLKLYELADPAGYLAAEHTNPGAATTPSETRPSMALATVYLYWVPKAMSGKPHIICDGLHVADLSSGRFIVMKMPAGSHTISVSHGGTSTVTLSSAFEAGTNQYVRLAVEGFVAHFALRAATAAEATAEMREKRITSNDPEKTYSTGCGSTGGRK